MSAIMEYQEEYFLSGDEKQMKPMILKDIAEITEPIAAASIAQVHFAKIKIDGQVKDVAIKSIDPIWCMDAKIICAPESTVKIPKKVWKKRNIKINKAVFLK